MNKLEIKRESQGEEIILKCFGRLDANWAGHLNDYIDALVREGHYHVSLDMTGIEYLSSAGIRSLVSQFKNLKKINGHFSIIKMSDHVNEILTMVGMLDMLSKKAKMPTTPSSKDESHKQISSNGFTFKLSKLSAEAKSDLNFYGKPELCKNAGFKASEARSFQSKQNNFAIGLGAIGDSFDECKNRCGEFIMLGKNIAYLPADGSKKPDYMISRGKLVASLTELYGLHFEGNFSHFIQFDAEKNNSSITLSNLIENILKLTNYKKIALVMLAESGGLIGASLNSSPVDGKKLFDYPEIKDTFNFTTEAVHNKMLTLSVACFSKDKTDEKNGFLRKIADNSNIHGHIHSCVFPYIPLKKKEINLSETIDELFNSSELLDVLHLMNDSRKIVGLGESEFKQGFCWIVPIESINKI